MDKQTIKQHIDLFYTKEFLNKYFTLPNNNTTKN